MASDDEKLDEELEREKSLVDLEQAISDRARARKEEDPDFQVRDRPADRDERRSSDRRRKDPPPGD